MDQVRDNLNEKFMQMAIQEARKNLHVVQGGPFGACIVKDKFVVAVARNTVLVSDATAHAEVNAIRIASQKLKTYNLSGCVIYATTELCPMCFSAIHWARLDAVIYGTRMVDVQKRGFNELLISPSRMKIIGKSEVRILPGFLYDACESLLEDWDRLEHKQLY